MKKKLCFILFISLFSLSLVFLCLFSFFQKKTVNNQQQKYLSEQMVHLHSQIKKYAMRSRDSFLTKELKDIFQLYTKGSNRSAFLMDSSRQIVMHSNSDYNNSVIPLDSFFHSLAKQYPQGWNGFFSTNKNQTNSIITIGQPVEESAFKGFIIIKQSTESFWSPFLFYLKYSIGIFVFVYLLLLIVLYFYLNPLIQAMDFLLKLFSDSEKIEKKDFLMKLTHNNNRYLKSIHSSLVAFLKSKKQPVTLQKLDFSFTDIISQVIQQSKHIYPNLSITIQFDADITVPVFVTPLSQAIWELIKNGVETGGEDSEINIHTFKEDNWFYCEVSDTGPGMDKDIASKACDLYFSTKPSSAGLGLNLVETVLARLGGLINFHSPKKGGLQVSLSIPLDYIDHVKNLTKHSQEFSREWKKTIEI